MQDLQPFSGQKEASPDAAVVKLVLLIGTEGSENTFGHDDSPHDGETYLSRSANSTMVLR